MGVRFRRSTYLAVAAAAAAAFVLGCAREPRRPQMRHTSESYYFTVEADQLPPHAREPIHYSVLVRDKETRQPIDLGEGQIYSSNIDGAQTFDGLAKGPEVGTYTGTLNFVTSGQWAVAIRFRRDSTARLEKVEWMQDVLGERDTGTP
ncbi:MAG TPA: hypothetical protein VFT96_06535 [Gemmatimonadaceae bacterium]|nr:hypothetical protein [Gemmatimonadaceae bacterium]